MDILSEFICKIKQGILLKKIVIPVKKSKFIIDILSCLLQEKYIRGYSVSQDSILVYPKYLKDRGIIYNVVRVSKRSKRIYYTAPVLRKKLIGPRAFLVSNTKGLRLYRRNNFLLEGLEGGEILLKLN